MNNLLGKNTTSPLIGGGGMFSYLLRARLEITSLSAVSYLACLTDPLLRLAAILADEKRKK